jgi:hypothetical protein
MILRQLMSDRVIDASGRASEAAVASHTRLGPGRRPPVDLRPFCPRHKLLIYDGYADAV